MPKADAQEPGAAAQQQDQKQEKQENVEIDTDILKDVIGDLGINLDDEQLEDIVKEAQGDKKNDENDKKDDKKDKK